MFEAMTALFQAMEDEDISYALHLDVAVSPSGEYIVKAMAYNMEQERSHQLFAAVDPTIEGATAKLLEMYKEKFEGFRAAKVADLNKILEAHSGVIKGARSKIKR